MVPEDCAVGCGLYYDVLISGLTNFEMLASRILEDGLLMMCLFSNFTVCGSFSGLLWALSRCAVTVAVEFVGHDCLKPLSSFHSHS